MASKSVFISYRRDPLGKAFAGRISDALKKNGYNAFLDGENFESGDWKKQLYHEITRRGHFLILLTPNALIDCREHDDDLRFEIETAFTSERNIVPVMEETNDLNYYKSSCPDDLKKIFNKQGWELRHNRFHDDFQVLLQNFIPYHKAAPPFSNSGRLSSLVAVKRKLLNAILPLMHNLLTIFVIASLVLVLLSDTYFGGRDFSYLIILAVAVKGLWSVLDLPKEARTFAGVALVFIAFGTTILVSRYRSKEPFNDSSTVIGFSTLAFGLGMAMVAPSFRTIQFKLKQ